VPRARRAHLGTAEDRANSTPPRARKCPACELTRASIPVTQSHRAVLALAGLTAPPGRGAAGVPVQATASAGVGMYSPGQMERLAAELGERERVLRLREEALRRREGRVTDTGNGFCLHGE
jgi:hypothetical protein